MEVEECSGSYLFYVQKKWEPHIGLHLDEFSCTLGMCLAVYIPQFILWKINGTVWVWVVGYLGPVR